MVKHNTASRPDMAAEVTIADWIRLIRAEYLEIPGLQLTEAQVQRQWNIDATLCEALLDTLVQVKFLKCSRGFYFRDD
jgi:hypothetical protein